MDDKFVDLFNDALKSELTGESLGLKPLSAQVLNEFHRYTPEKLITDPYFLNLKGSIYPAHLKIINEIYEAKKEFGINLVLISAGIGSGKTYLADVLSWLEWFYYSTVYNPRERFPFIDPNTNTCFIMMSRTEKQAKTIVFDILYKFFKNSQFNKDYFPPNPKVKSSLNIPRNNTLIFPGTGDSGSALGYNVYSGIVDEMNFLDAVSTNSSSANIDLTDSAQAMYEQLRGRVFSRFGHDGGLIIGISSANKPGSWMELKMKESIQQGMNVSKIFSRRIPLWKAKPPKFFDTNEFFLFNTETFQIVTDPDMIEEYIEARDKSTLPSDFNPLLGGLMI